MRSDLSTSMYYLFIEIWQIDLSANHIGLGGVDGVKALADALGVNASITSLSLGDNNLGDEGVEALSIGLKDNKSLLTLDLHNESPYSTKFGPKGAAALASALAVMASITQVCYIRKV